MILFLSLVSNLDIRVALTEAGEDKDQEEHLSVEDSLEYVAGCIKGKVQNSQVVHIFFVKDILLVQISQHRTL